jgi:hypothetical protein
MNTQGTMEECRDAYLSAADWFAFWLRGDVVEREAALIAAQAAAASRLEAGGGPLLRAQSARWLAFGAGGDGTAAELARHANLLCREFALGGCRCPAQLRLDAAEPKRCAGLARPPVLARKPRAARLRPPTEAPGARPTSRASAPS